MGTPEDVVMRPVNDYVREFTKDVPRSRVLTAKSIMQPAPLVVSENDSLATVMPLLIGQDSAVAFVQGENGRFLGTICLDPARTKPSNDSTVRSLIKQNYPTTTSTTTLADLIPFVASTQTPVPVVDDEQALLGVIDRVSVMLALGGVENAVENALGNGAVNQADNGSIDGTTD
jgi:glycine betaine/proline transport system ATP-binding protein